MGGYRIKNDLRKRLEEEKFPRYIGFLNTKPKHSKKHSKKPHKNHAKHHGLKKHSHKKPLPPFPFPIMPAPPMPEEPMPNPGGEESGMPPMMPGEESGMPPMMPGGDMTMTPTPPPVNPVELFKKSITCDKSGCYVFSCDEETGVCINAITKEVIDDPR